MLFAISAQDRPGALETRLATRPTHLKYLEDNDAVVVLGGPFLDADEKPCGSLVVIKAETQAEAEAFAAADPYAQAGLFQSVEVRPWNWVVKRPEAV